jgi:hypothetical protein
VTACPAILGDLCRAIDMYCERTSPDLFAEPLNALTNIAFLIAAFAAWRFARRHGATPVVRILIATTAAIGVGSFLFHTIATAWAVLADIIPIFVFMLVYLWHALRRYLGWSSAGALIGLLVYIAASAALPAIVPRSLAAGGAGYLPALIAMAAIGLATLGTESATGRRLLAAAFVFLVSLTARTLDGPLCATMPAGTHFLWHTLNAVVLYLLIRAAIPKQPSVIPAEAGTQ